MSKHEVAFARAVTGLQLAVVIGGLTLTEIIGSRMGHEAEAHLHASEAAQQYRRQGRAALASQAAEKAHTHQHELDMYQELAIPTFLATGAGGILMLKSRWSKTKD